MAWDKTYPLGSTVINDFDVGFPSNWSAIESGLGGNATLTTVSPIYNVSTKTAAYTTITTDSMLLCDATSAAFTITLITAVGNTGKKYIIKKIDASVNSITIDPNGAETIGGSLTYSLTYENDEIEIVSDGANWKILGTRALIISNPSSTNTIVDMLTLDRQTTGTPAAGIGVGIVFNVEDAGGTEKQGSIDLVVDNVTDAGEDSSLRFNVQNGGTITEGMKLVGQGASAIPFLGIGTSFPRTRLSVNNGANNTAGDVVKEVLLTAPTSEPTATGSANIMIQANDAMAADKGGSIGFGARTTSASTIGKFYAGIFGAKENATSGNEAGYLALYTRSATAITERLRIDSMGLVGIGTANPRRTNTGGVFPKLDVAHTDYAKADANADRQIIFFGSNDASNPLGISMAFRSNPTAASRYCWIDSSEIGAVARPLIFQSVSGGNVGIGSVTNPTAKLHLPAGTATVAPFKLTSGTSLTTAEAGAMEFTTDSLYFTITTGTARKTVEFREKDYAAKTGAYTATIADYMISCDATTAAFTITLPTAVEISGRIYIIKKTDSSTNAVTVDGNGTETIDGNLTFLLKSQYAEVTIISNGANWEIIEQRFAKAYGQAYRTTSYSIAAVNTWYDLDLNGGNNNLKNVTHSTVTTPDRLTVTYAGVYRISFLVHTLQAGAAFGADCRLRINDITEIPGSAVGGGDAGGSIQTPVSVSIITSLAANDFITLQVGANTTGAIIARYNDANNPDPTTTIVANVTIEKIDE